ncbi:MAG: glycosyltransferase family 4 protein [Flavobacteriia bacterium]|nr:glycosyltransferase family 4 protein [Flavobacteriia bacterium]
MRIVFGINNFDNAGAENFMLRLAKYFSVKGHEIALFSLLPIEEKHLNRVKIIFGDTFSSVELIGPYLPNRFLDFFLWKINRAAMIVGKLDWRKEFIENKTKQKIVNFKPDLLNSHLFETDDFFSKDLTIPHVISMHGPYEYYLYKDSNDDGELDQITKATGNEILNNNFIERAEKALSKSKNVIYCADKNLEILQHIEISNLILEKIYYGYERKEQSVKNREIDQLNIGMFARGVESKGWDILIAAFLRLEDKYEHITLMLAFSETNYMDYLKLKYVKHEKIQFLGLIDPIDEFLSSIDLVAFPTYYPGESLPNTIIESLMFDIPVISTQHAEIPNMIQYNGLLAGTIVPIQDVEFDEQVKRFSDAIEKYLINPNFLQEKKENCKIVSNQFEMDTCYNKYLDFFSKVTNQNP